MERWAVYRPGASSIEGAPTVLQMFLRHPAVMSRPHWHVQVEVNYIMRGSVHYRMNTGEISLRAGDLCLFWGGQPHQMDECTDDAVYGGAHLPLVHFFRMRLPIDVSSRLMRGEILLTSATDAADAENFPRWMRYAGSADPAKAQHALEEMILRMERIVLEPHALLAATGVSAAAKVEHPQPQPSPGVARMCDFIAANFLQEITSADIARAADLHPKYAMSVFKKTTGMTLGKYVTLLRLSRAQAMLLRQGAHVLDVAMQSGFGSISAFNKSFRQIAGMSPSDFRRDARIVAHYTRMQTERD